MAIDFPTSKYTVADGTSQNSWPGSPSSGDTATANSYTYTYNGTLWVMNTGSTKSFTGGATYTWDGEKWDASNIPDNSNVVQAASSGWANGELLQYNSGSWDSVDLIIDEDNMSSDSDTKIPTQQSVKSYVDNQVAGLIDSAPGALDTLNELAAAIGDDANFATTVNNNIATKLPLAGGTMTGNIVMSGTETVDGRDLSVDGAKLDLIEAGATGDQTAAEIKSAYESNSDTNAYTDAEKTKLSGIETGATADQTNAEIKTAYELNANTNAFTDAEKTKLTGIEAGATADQTDAEIKTAYESNADTNAFTDAEKTKLTGVEAGATADQTAAEIRTLVESANDSNVFTDADHTKLNGIEANATADQTAAEIRALVESATDSNVFTDADHTKLNGIAAGAEVNVATNLGQTTGASSLTITSSTGSNITVAEASGSIAGLMSTTHHNKLDGIESGATADQTAAEIKSLYESNSNTNEFSDAEQTKLAGIETGADVTDATNVNAAGAVMNSDTSTGSMSFVVDEDNMSSNSPSKVPTQQSVKSYVDNQVASVVDSAPAALDTLNELAAALGDDANFSTTIATSIGEKLPLVGGTMTGAIAMSSNKITGLGTPTASTDASTKGYVDTQISASGSGTVTSVSGTSPISVTNGTSTPAISISAATTSAAGTMSSSDKSKLNGIEANADVTDATNVNAAGAVMNSDTSTASMSFVIDQDNMSSNSATKVPTQQSVKAYVDNEISGVSGSTNLSTSTTSTTVTVASSTGTNATIAGVTTSNAGVMLASDKSKLNGIESGATADQTASEIKTAYESNSNTNAYTDAEKTKLAGIAAGAEVNVQSNWNASSGDAAILNKPTIPTNNNQLTNGAGYITSADGGDADTVDGIQAASFMRVDADDNCLRRITFKECATDNHDNMATTTSYLGAFEIQNSGSGNDAFMAFHAASDYALYFGLDADSNKLAVGGWSMGANKYQIWHEGNQGAGTNLDADKLDGQHGSYYSNYNNLSNKPTIPSAYTNSSVDSHLNTSSASSGDSLTWNGSDYAWSAASSGGGADVQEFTSSGTWTKPSGCSIVEVWVFGAGGGGGGGGTSGGSITGGYGGPVFIRSGGGGGGSFVKYRYLASNLGSTVSVTIGAGGSGGNGTSSTTTYNHGTAGGNSSFGTLLARGGMGGPAAVLVPNAYQIKGSSIETAYNYPEAVDSSLRIPGQSFAFWLQYGYPTSIYAGDAPASPDKPAAGGNGGGVVDYGGGTDTSLGLGAQGMFAEFNPTGMTSVSSYYGANAGAVNAWAGSNASNKFQSGNGGNGSTGAGAAVMTGGNGGIAAGGGGGGSHVQNNAGGGDGGDGGNGYCIVFSW